MSKRKNVFPDEYKKEVENRTLLRKMLFLEINVQIHVLTLVVKQTISPKIVSFWIR